MNKKISQLLMLALMALTTLDATRTLYAQDALGKPFVLTVQADRESYLPGEAVQLRLSLANQSGAVVKAARPDVGNGTLSLFLAFGKQPFQLYRGPDQNSLRSLSTPVTDLAAGESVTVQTTMLYHRLQSTSHLTELYARPIREKELNNYFALDRIGQYRLKAVYKDALSKMTVESEPIAITVREPYGSDRMFWEGVKDDPDAAFLLHTGSLGQPSNTVRTREFVEKMMRLMMLYPDSSIAQKAKERLPIDK